MSSGPDGDGNPFAGITVPRVPAPQAIADGLRDLILRGQLEPGTPLREATVGAALGVSRNTLREALRILVQEGLVTHRPHHGAVVSELTPADVSDLFRSRQAIELRAADLCGAATAEQLEAIEAARRARDTAVDTEDWPGAFEADMRFHQAIVALAGSRRLDAFCLGLMRELRLAYRRLDGFEDERLERDRRQHNQIAKALEAGDVARARKAVTVHLADAEALLLELLGRPASPERPRSAERA